MQLFCRQLIESISKVIVVEPRVSMPALCECLLAGAEGLDHTGLWNCADSVEIDTKHSTANLVCVREEAKEPVVLSHWRQEDPCMHLGDVYDENSEPGCA